MIKPIAIIPARGGSKRIPKKNIVEFNGKPLIAWTIECALASECFSAVYVSTDSDEIAEVSRKQGARVPFLRDAFADDNSTVSQGSAHFVKQLQDTKLETSRCVVQLMANCPIRSIETIQNFVGFATSCPELSSVISVVEPKFGTPFWAMKKDKNNKGEFVFSQFMSERSQDLPECFYPTGSLWFSSTERLLQTENFYSEGYRIKEIPWLEAIDIDTQEELHIAQVLHAAHAQSIL